MRLPLALVIAALSALPAAAADADGARWWSHVETLAGPQFEGRLTGTPGYDKAAAYAAGQFKAFGLKPAGTDGYLQPMKFTVQRVLTDGSSAALVVDGQEQPLRVGPDLLLARACLSPRRSRRRWCLSATACTCRRSATTTSPART